MKENYFKVFFKVFYQVNGLQKSMYRNIEGIRDAMESELIRVYNLYADKINGGVTEKLNDEFENLHPNYFKENRDKEWYDLIEYNKFISDGYQRLVIDKFNETNISPILNFYVDSSEVVFTGYLKFDRNVTISFYMKQV